MAGEDDPNTRINGDPGKGYGLSVKMMSGAIIILFVVVIFMIAVHLYGRWYILRTRRRQLERRRERLVSRSNILMYIDSLASVNRGLEQAVLNSLPVFLYSPKAGQPPMECAVCLSEFEEKDMVRLLPDCNHSFHIDCIDLWFRAHSTCPICRSPVEMVDRIIKPVWKTTGAEPGSSSGSWICDACHQEEGNGDGSESLSEGLRRGLELLEVRVNMPPRRAQLENELRQSSLGSRVVSVRGILSVGRRSPGVAVPTMSHEAGTSLVATELEQKSGHQVRAGTST